MIMTTVWPGAAQLGLEGHLQAALMESLVEPFGNSTDAEQFWAVTPTQLFIVHADDSECVLETLTENCIRQMRFAFQAPDCVTELVGGYSLYLNIISDDGGGLYLLIHRDSGVGEALKDG